MDTKLLKSMKAGQQVDSEKPKGKRFETIFGLKTPSIKIRSELFRKPIKYIDYFYWITMFFIIPMLIYYSYPLFVNELKHPKIVSIILVFIFYCSSYSLIIKFLILGNLCRDMYINGLIKFEYINNFILNVDYNITGYFWTIFGILILPWFFHQVIAGGNSTNRRYRDSDGREIIEEVARPDSWSFHTSIYILLAIVVFVSIGFFIFSITIIGKVLIILLLVASFIDYKIYKLLIYETTYISWKITGVGRFLISVLKKDKVQ